MKPWLLALLLTGHLQAAERLTIVSVHWEGFRYEFGRAFSEWHQLKYGAPVEVDWRDLGGSSDNLRFVLNEFKQKPDGIGVDLFFGGGVDPYLTLGDKLQEYRPDLSGVPADVGGVPVYDPDHRWFGVALSSFGILYNKRVQAPVVNSWLELAEKAPIGSIGSGDPRNSGTVHMMYEMILQRYGWDEGWRILTLLAAKIRAFDRAASTSAKDVSAGNTAYTLAIDFYALTQISAAGKENVGFILPQDCATVSPDGIGILKGAPNLTIARRFVDFCVGEDGQLLLMLPRGHPGGAKKFSIERMSIRPALYDRLRDVTLVPINPFEQPVTFRYDAGKGGARWGALNDLIGATLIDVHEELVTAYKRTGRVDATPPVTEKELLAKTDRQRRIIEWQRWAQRKYESLTSVGQ